MEALKSLQANLDLDEAEHLTNFDRRQVCVPEVCDCKREYCRYKDYMKQCSSKRYLFQICNHNLFLADAMHRGERRRPIFPEYSALVMDESHKLPEVAREMFGVTLSAEDLQSTIGRPEKLQIQPVQVANDSCVEFKAHLDKILAIQPVDEDSARDLVFKLASARYDQIGSAEYETERLKRIFAAAEPMETLDAELLKNTVAAIHIQENGAICLELKNHQMIAR